MGFRRDLSATASACMIANACTHPLEMLKTRQMLGGGGIISVARNVVGTEGALALYKGLTPALARGAISGGGRLAGYNALKASAERHGLTGSAGPGSDVPLKALLAVAAGVAAQLAAAPFDLARTRQTMATGPQPTMAAVLTGVVQQSGAAGLFTGVVPLLGRTVCFNVSQLLSYDWTKRWSMELLGTAGSDDPRHHVAAAAPASAVAGLAATMASCPAENVKTVMQARTAAGNVAGGRGPGSRGVTGSLVRTVVGMARVHGVSVFWRGWVPLYAKLGPHTMLVFVLTEKLRGVVGIDSVT